jgi:hypothetical protein
LLSIIFLADNIFSGVQELSFQKKKKKKRKSLQERRYHIRAVFLEKYYPAVARNMREDKL